MLTYNEDKTIVFQCDPDINVVTHFFPDIDFPHPVLDDSDNVVGWKFCEARTYEDLAKNRTYVWGHMEGTTIIYDKICKKSHDLIGW